ncbi:helix-turn-helix transcriptional regulator, partial [Treponema pectinovorum]|uniref:helix-turn-helix transcriptional regulator n=1 Tax=Treponema pectinovorum TaxID=164 RepID=UPI0016595880
KADGQSTGKSSEEIAAVLGVSTRTAERMRNIINNADDETLEAVKSGTVSISKADKITTEKKYSSYNMPYFMK